MWESQPVCRSCRDTKKKKKKKIGGLLVKQLVAESRWPGPSSSLATSVGFLSILFRWIISNRTKRSKRLIVVQDQDTRSAIIEHSKPKFPRSISHTSPPPISYKILSPVYFSECLSIVSCDNKNKFKKKSKNKEREKGKDSSGSRSANFVKANVEVV